MSYDPLSHSRHNAGDRSTKVGHEIRTAKLKQSKMFNVGWCVVYSVHVAVFSMGFEHHPHTFFLQVAQLSQRDRAAGWVSYGQKWKTVNIRQHFTDIIGLSSTTMT